jgi:hypothetical protein
MTIEFSGSITVLMRRLGPSMGFADGSLPSTLWLHVIKGFIIDEVNHGA